MTCGGVAGHSTAVPGCREQQVCQLGLLPRLEVQQEDGVRGVQPAGHHLPPGVGGRAVLTAAPVSTPGYQYRQDCNIAVGSDWPEVLLPEAEARLPALIALQPVPVLGVSAPAPYEVENTAGGCGGGGGVGERGAGEDLPGQTGQRKGEAELDPAAHQLAVHPLEAGETRPGPHRSLQSALCSEQFDPACVGVYCESG